MPLSATAVPDQIITLVGRCWPRRQPQGPPRGLSALGRTGRGQMPDQLLEQSPDWPGASHGETGDALLKQNALNERDRLVADDAICHDLLNTRTW